MLIEPKSMTSRHFSATNTELNGIKKTEISEEAERFVSFGFCFNGVPFL